MGRPGLSVVSSARTCGESGFVDFDLMFVVLVRLVSRGRIKTAGRILEVKTNRGKLSKPATRRACSAHLNRSSAARLAEDYAVTVDPLVVGPVVLDLHHLKATGGKLLDQDFLGDAVPTAVLGHTLHL